MVQIVISLKSNCGGGGWTIPLVGSTGVVAPVDSVSNLLKQATISWEGDFFFFCFQDFGPQLD